MNRMIDVVQVSNQDLLLLLMLLDGTSDGGAQMVVEGNSVGGGGFTGTGEPDVSPWMTLVFPDNRSPTKLTRNLTECNGNRIHSLHC